MNSLASKLNGRIDYLSEAYRADARYLGVIRILFALHVILFPVDYSWAAKVPSAFFNPNPGVAWLYQDVPPELFLLILEFLRFCLAILLLVGFKTKFVSVTLTVVMILGSSVVHSFSKIDHNILYELLPAFMASAGWGATYSVDNRLRASAQRTQGFGVLIWASLISFALFSAGLPKALTGWLNPSLEASRSYVAMDLANPVKIGPLAEYFFAFDQQWFWKFIDYATVFAESWLIVAFLFPVLFRFGIAMVLAFHAGVYLMLGIDFAHYLFVYAVFFSAPFFQTIKWIQGKRTMPPAKIRAPHFIQRDNV